VLIRTLWYHGRFGFQAIFVEIIEFLGKILLEDYTLTYLEPKYTKGLELLCQKIGLFYETKKPFQNAISSIFFAHGRSDMVFENSS
jgi:hypothetical protein